MKLTPIDRLTVGLDGWQRTDKQEAIELAEEVGADEVLVFERAMNTLYVVANNGKLEE